MNNELVRMCYTLIKAAGLWGEKLKSVGGWWKLISGISRVILKLMAEVWEVVDLHSRLYERQRQCNSILMLPEGKDAQMCQNVDAKISGQHNSEQVGMACPQINTNKNSHEENSSFYFYFFLPFCFQLI